jgi:hypothetical protein
MAPLSSGEDFYFHAGGGGGSLGPTSAPLTSAPSRKRKKTKSPKNRAGKSLKSNGKKEGEFVKNLVFVGMAFRGDGMGDAFSAIKETCKSLKLNARRVDDNTTSGFIVLEIVDLIKKAEFIIFDLTHERPNVYYELGYTHGVGNSPSNVLLLARDGTELHFDIAALRVQFYRSTENLRSIVKSNLSGMIRQTRGESTPASRHRAVRVSGAPARSSGQGKKRTRNR